MDGLMSVDFVNVANLSLVRYSFKLSAKATKTRVTIRNSSLEVLPSNVFHGDIETIVMDNTRISHVTAFAFANLINTNSITLENCRINNLEALAFKKFDVKFLHIIGGSLGDRIPSRVMNDIEVTDKFMLDGVRMGTIQSSAFIIRKPKTVAILNCAINDVEGEAFDITASGTVIIKNNTLEHVSFGAFLSIRADTDNRQPSGQPHSLMFKDNNVTNFEEGSLLFDRNSFRVEFSNVLVNQACDCDQINIWRSQILNYTNVYSRLITSREGTTSIVAPPFTLESSVDDPETFLCLEDPESSTTMSFVKYENRHCVLSSSMLFLILALSALVLVLLFVTCLVVYCCRKRRRDAQKRWISVPTTAPDVVNSKMAKNGNVVNVTAGGAPVDSRITMVVPDGRLYRETEFHVIVEKAEPLTTEL
ncbi:uncharacterized protein LOC131674623 isoform X2 [Phymastichus coffea]|nr:uncharacterized protein LOC131674623 isoform X2 [Phymastichus coffea]XP_058809382.1 uncharacterized protein LOC131674623 isoform X2 [Phymastichus coffea]